MKSIYQTDVSRSVHELGLRLLRWPRGRDLADAAARQRLPHPLWLGGR